MIERAAEISHIEWVYTIASSVKNHRLYPEFLKVRQTLAAHQFVCWIAGGAVRDFCLGREVGEFDLVTDASTEILKELFPAAVLVGESFGVIKIPLPGGEFLDLATFREEAEYRDGRRPSQVFSSTPTKDSVRRDFTVNAMYWNDQAGAIVDYQNGIEALEQKRLACVGDPDTRFNEDYLRIIRLVRFGVQLQFEFEAATEASACRKKEFVLRVSGERIWAELRKMEKSANWNHGLGHNLFCAVISEIFSVPVPLPKSVPESASLFLFIYLLNPAGDFGPLLKTRLKVSNAELQTYAGIRFLLQNQNKMSVAEMAFSLEKTPFLHEQFRQLHAGGILSPEYAGEVEKRLADHAVVLVAASEILNLIPNRFISEELKNIRIDQLNGVFKTKAEVVEYLKKKYAN
jgi:tRNA nucleotidyltransferase/poly(A) polymerase